MKALEKDEKLTQVRINILQHFSRNGNTFSLPADIAHSFSRPLHVGNVKKSCENFSNEGILERKTGECVPGKGRGYKPQYRLKPTFENLKFVVLSLPDDRDIAISMKSTFYTEMLPQIFEFFERGLQDLGYNSFDPEARKIVEECLKISPSCLKFVLNKEKYKSSKENLENLFVSYISKTPKKDRKKVKINFQKKDPILSNMIIAIFLLKIPDDIMEELIPISELNDLMKSFISYRKTLAGIIPYNSRKQMRDEFDKYLE